MLSISYFARMMASSFLEVIWFLYILELSLIILIKNKLYNINIQKKKKKKEDRKTKGLFQTSVALRLQLSWVPKPSILP